MVGLKSTPDSRLRRVYRHLFRSFATAHYSRRVFQRTALSVKNPTEDSIRFFNNYFLLHIVREEAIV